MSEKNLEGLADFANAMPYVRWGLGHIDEIPTILEGAQAVKEAVGLNAKWDAIKSNGDNVVAILADFPNIDNLLGGGSPSPFLPMAGLANSGLMACYDPSITGSDAFKAAVEKEAANLGKLGDGTFLKMFLENLPAIMSAAVTLIGLFR